MGFEFVEGNAELTPARLVGHFDPARVMAEGYDPNVFVDGPLASALRDGVAAVRRGDQPRPRGDAERAHHRDERGRAARARASAGSPASPGFRLVAAMNPFDAIGTARISGAVYDRVCRLAVGYQSASDESDITRRAARTDDLDPRWVDKVVELVRLTRTHPDLRVGSSVRGAIDMCAVASSLGRRAWRPGRGRRRVARCRARRAVGPGPAPRGHDPHRRRHHPRAVGIGVRHRARRVG